MAKRTSKRKAVPSVPESLPVSTQKSKPSPDLRDLLPGIKPASVIRAGPASRVDQKSITFSVSDERFRTLDMARRALPDRPTWSVLGNAWAEEWLASLPDELFRITR